jgi:acetyltransferase-like isoleucine patch superfamily enzyme
VKIADLCFICDNSGHPLDSLKRREKGVDLEDIRPVVIEDDVWLASRVIVLPGVRIGRGSVVGAGSVVTKDVPAFCLAAGNPARALGTLQNAEELERARGSAMSSVS